MCWSTGAPSKGMPSSGCSSDSSTTTGRTPTQKTGAGCCAWLGFWHQKNRALAQLVRIVHESRRGADRLGCGDQGFSAGRAQAGRGTRRPQVAGRASSTLPRWRAHWRRCPDLPYSKWLRVGMALHSTGGGQEGLDLWDRWSSRGKLYKDGECAYRWGTFGRSKNRQVTLGTLFRMASEAGWDGEITLDPDVLPLVEQQRVQDVVAFGKRHGVVMVQGKAAIIYRERDANTRRWTTRFSAQGDMALKFAPEKVPFVEEVKDELVIKRKPLLPIWMAARLRRTYDQVEFRLSPGSWPSRATSRRGAPSICTRGSPSSRGPATAP